MSDPVIDGCELPWQCCQPAVERLAADRASAGTAAHVDALAGLDGCAACQRWYEAHDVPAVVIPLGQAAHAIEAEAHAPQATADQSPRPRSGRSPQRPPPEVARRGALFQVDRYHVYAAVASGSMGSTYRAWDPRLLRPIAIKLLDGVTADQPMLALREAQASAAIDHPNLVPVYDAGQDPATGLGYIVSAWITGETLADRLKARAGAAIQPLPWPNAVAIARQVLSAVAALHRHGVVHRDLKPANLMLEAEGRVRVLDLGIARVGPATEGPRGRSGTRGYMSPEQIAGRDERDPRSDLYAVGLILREMLTGQPPRHAPAGAASADDPPTFDAPLTVLADLRAILAQSLTRDPADRYQSADDMSAALDDAVHRPPRSTPVDLTTGQAHQSAFLHEAERWVQSRPDWFDSVNGRPVRRVGGLEGRRGVDMVDPRAQHGATALANWRSWGVRGGRRFRVFPGAVAVRVVAVTAARLDRFMAGQRDDVPADRELLIRAIGRGAQHAGTASAVVLVGSPTGWMPDVLLDATVHRPGLCVVLYDSSRPAGPWAPAGGAAAIAWTEQR